MKMRDQCLPCLVNQIIKVANITNVQNKQELYKKVFHHLSTADFNITNPEMIGATFRLLKQHIGNDDPYKDIRKYYNELFLKESQRFEEIIQSSNDSFQTAVEYAIVGNIIDFNPIHNKGIEDIMKCFDSIKDMNFGVNHILRLKEDIVNAKTLLYVGDNCGEICLDKILIKEIKTLNPSIDIYFAVRGEAVVNDSIEEDAYFVGMDQYATIVNNGDDSLGTILNHVSQEFLDVYHKADLLITKGQANYESLSEEVDKKIYFLLVSKCQVIADDIGVSQQSLICLGNL